MLLPTRMPLALSCATLLLAAGCGPVDPAGAARPAAVGGDLTTASPEDALTHFMLRTPGGNDVSVLVTDAAITGPRIQLSRDARDHSLRGEAFRKVVSVDVTPEGVVGIYAGGPFNIKIVLEGEDIVVRGLVAGRPSAFRLGPLGLEGNVGQCMYQMRRQGAEFTGTRGCGTGSSMASMSFPASFGRWSMAEMAAALSIMLGAGS